MASFYAQWRRGNSLLAQTRGGAAGMSRTSRLIPDVSMHAAQRK